MPIWDYLSLCVLCAPGVLLLSIYPSVPHAIYYMLYCSLYIPQGDVLFCGTLSRNCLYTVLFVRKAMFMLMCLNKLVVLCKSWLWYVNVAHVFHCVFVTVSSVFLCCDLYVL
jgi:hypothetical protein